jgi:hypothetical protein
MVRFGPQRVREMNAEIERLYRDGCDDEARRLEIRANALARRLIRAKVHSQ